jgi:uncharacterized membrane protein YdjX (TVP38/TMEM64 family)
MMVDVSIMFISATLGVVAGAVLGFVFARELFQDKIDDLHQLNEFLERSIRSCERGCSNHGNE